MSFELSVKSIVVEESTSDVAPGVIVIGVVPAVNTLMIAISLVGSQLQRTVEAFSVAFDDRHLFFWCFEGTWKREREHLRSTRLLHQ